MDDHNADTVRIAYHHRTFLLDVGTCHKLSLLFDGRPLTIEVAFADVGQLWRRVLGRHIVGSVLQRHDRSPSFAECKATCSRSCGFPGHTCVGPKSALFMVRWSHSLGRSPRRTLWAAEINGKFEQSACTIMPITSILDLVRQWPRHLTKVALGP